MRKFTRKGELHMSFLDYGCTCDRCMKATLQNLQEARGKWNNGEREILFKSYHYSCGDGCCDDWGKNVYVNGFELLGCDGEDTESVIASLMEFLNIDNVNVDYEYEDE